MSVHVHGLYFCAGVISVQFYGFVYSKKNVVCQPVPAVRRTTSATALTYRAIVNLYFRAESDRDFPQLFFLLLGR